MNIIEGDEWKTMFKTNTILYKWLVMSFGLTNILGTFIRLMIGENKPFLCDFLVIYLDAILIFSTTRD